MTPLQTRSDSDTILFSCSGSCLSLAGNFQIPGNRRGVKRAPSHLACTDVNTVSTQHIAPIRHTLTRGSSGPFHKWSFHLLFRAMSHDLPRTPSTSTTSFFTVLYFSFAHRRRLKVDPVQNTLRRFTRRLK